MRDSHTLRTEHPPGRIGPDPIGWRLIPDEQLDPARVEIIWRVDSEGHAYDVAVFAMEDSRRFDLRGSYSNSGAVYGDWMRCDVDFSLDRLTPPSHLNPAGLFGALITHYGFKNKEEAKKAVLEFAKLKDEKWAQRMALSFE